MGSKVDSHEPLPQASSSVLFQMATTADAAVKCHRRTCDLLNVDNFNLSLRELTSTDATICPSLDRLEDLQVGARRAISCNRLGQPIISLDKRYTPYLVGKTSSDSSRKNEEAINVDPLHSDAGDKGSKMGKFSRLERDRAPTLS